MWENLSAIKEKFAQLIEKQAQIAQKQLEKTASHQSMELAKGEVQRHLAAFESAKSRTETAKILLQNAEGACQAASQGLDNVQWDEQKNLLATEASQLSSLKSVVEEQMTAKSAVEQHSSQMQHFQTQLKAANLQAQQLEVEIEQSRANLEEMERQNILQIRFQSHEEARSQLCTDEACPLCGSLEHPYVHLSAAGKIPYLNNIQEALAAAHKKHQALEKDSLTLAKSLSVCETHLRNSQKLHDEHRVAAERLLQKAQILWQQLEKGQDIFILPPLEELAARLASIKAQLKDCDKKHKDYMNKGKAKDAAQKVHERALQDYAQLEQGMAALHKRHEHSEKHFQEILQRISELEADKVRLENAALEEVKPYGLLQLEDADLDTLRDSLQKRVEAWKSQQLLKRQLEGDEHKLSAEMQLEKERLQCCERSIEELALKKSSYQSSQQALQSKREEIFGHKSPDAEETLLAKNVENAKEQLQLIKDGLADLQHRTKSTEEAIQALALQTEQRAGLLLAQEAEFMQQIQAAGFSDKEAYQLAFFQNPAERENWSNRKKALEKRKSELNALKANALEKLDLLNQDPQTEEAFSALQVQWEEMGEQLESTKTRAAILKAKMEENHKKRAAAQGVQAKILVQQHEAHIWGNLSALIGAADGKKFRDFAQKMTLDMMVAHANQQLIKMSDRYLLCQSKEASLELEVVDNYQASEERTVKNLSGGESFIVSLALALGLSKMASSKVRVDSLFLDEGFGTLDEKALEVALDTLAELQQEGKIIGLISHVGALKERISTQILVTPTSSGRSHLAGPGCSFKG